MPTDPRMDFNNAVFPDPTGPQIPIFSFFSIVRFKSSRHLFVVAAFKAVVSSPAVFSEFFEFFWSTNKFKIDDRNYIKVHFTRVHIPVKRSVLKRNYGCRMAVGQIRLKFIKQYQLLDLLQGCISFADITKPIWNHPNTEEHNKVDRDCGEGLKKLVKD